ncbi:hypothetical protein Pcinc_005375 [Petrolisthes cinctipes]|uniref:Transposase n=1 Tax=Petrolisthes cinctipes TaxID=88211 RepID=A0AAE1GDP2_PETCI|nr:hypothetical protein Pcinc_010899 [Petrolisthes cinctipes]KAK3890697.1 hypothetical protein Pcinc_005375 [Petrolisthes cinctipes]
MDSRQRRAVERGRIIGMCEAGYSISDIVGKTARIRAAVERNPFTNSVSVREQLGQDVSDRTIKRRLHESGY